MSTRSGFDALLEWTPSRVLPYLPGLSVEDFERAFEALGAQFEATLKKVKSSPKNDRKTLKEITLQYEKIQELGAILGALAMRDHAKFDAAWNRWALAEQKLLTRARSSRPLRSLLNTLWQEDISTGHAEALSRSSFWGCEAYEPAAKRAERRALAERERKLTERFKNNARVAATKTWVHVGPEQRGDLGRIPASVLGRAKARAAALGQKGWVFAAEFSAYGPFMQQCSNRKLREAMYKARSRLASEWGDKDRDNTQLGLEILKLRANQAKAAGKSSYAEYCMSSNTLPTPEAAEEFLLSLANSVSERAQKERQAALVWLRKKEGVRAMQPWDWRRAFNGLRDERSGDAQNESRAFFPVEETVERCCVLVAAFLGATSERDREAEAQSGASFIANWTRRGAKKPFARVWIEPWHNAKNGSNFAVHWPLVEPRAGVCGWSFITLRQDPLLGGMRHDDVSTLLHELGHAAHSLGPLSRWGEKGAANTEPDGFEFHSQFFERMVWDKETVDQLTGSGEGLPDELFARLNAFRMVSVASEQLAGIAESLSDLRVHGRSAAKRARLWDVFNMARQEVGLAAARSYKRFFHTSFAMTMDFSCADYSYAWTNVLAAQSFKAWQRDRAQKGPEKAAQRFNSLVLSQGSARALLAMAAEHSRESPSLQAYLDELAAAEEIGQTVAAG